MKKIIDTETVKYIEYDHTCPFDMAESLIDDYISVSTAERFMTDLHAMFALTEFGKDVHHALSIKKFGKATNKGIPKEVLNFYKRYDDWNKKRMAEEV